MKILFLTFILMSYLPVQAAQTALLKILNNASQNIAYTNAEVTNGTSLICFDVGHLSEILSMTLAMEPSLGDLVHSPDPNAQKAANILLQLPPRGVYLGSFCGEQYTVSDPSKLVPKGNLARLQTEIASLQQMIGQASQILQTLP